jgi:hypothetical protein
MKVFGCLIGLCGNTKQLHRKLDFVKKPFQTLRVSTLGIKLSDIIVSRFFQKNNIPKLQKYHFLNAKSEDFAQDITKTNSYPEYPSYLTYSYHPLYLSIQALL